MAEIRRMRPWLGTFVEIRAAGADADALAGAMEAAFAAIARVHGLMSFHEAGSDLGRLNRDAVRVPVTVDPLTAQVLREALLLSARSGGLFDPTVADGLVATGFLPEVDEGSVGRRCGTWCDIEVGDDGRVRFHRPLLIDLGGIAKGFAVDQAVAALMAGGADRGIVNAGGDLRVFGGVEQVIHLRDPRSPTQLATTITLRDRAMATSAPYFALRRHDGRRVSPLIDPRSGESCTRTVSVTVQAPGCLHADALTKVVLTDPVQAAAVLSFYDATATVLGGDGTLPQARHAEQVLQA